MYEQILLENKALPCKITLVVPGNETGHIHENLCFLYMMKGSAVLDIAGRHVTLQEGGIEFINAFEPHVCEEHTHNSRMLRIEIDMEHYCSMYPKLKGKYFTAYAGATDRDLERLNNIVGRIIMETLDREPQFLLNISGYLNEMVILLDDKFSRKNIRSIPGRDNITQKHIRDLCDYLEKHYAEEWTLASLARRTSLPEGYFTRAFKNTTGLPPLKYLNTVRINKSIGDLLGTRDGIEKIAERFGFSNAKAYNRAFHSVYGMYPARYRRQNSENRHHRSTSSLCTNEEIRAAAERIAEENADYRTEDRSVPVCIDASAAGSWFKKPWKKMCGFGNVGDSELNDWHNQLGQVAQGIGFQYVLCRNIFAKEMHVVSYSGRRKSYNFGKLDLLFDFLDKLGLRPLIEFCFTPMEEEHSPDKDEAFGKGAADKEELITAFLLHLMSRYGRDKVTGWHFSLCVPYASPAAYDKSRCFEMFVRLFKAIKNVDVALQVGSAGFNWHFLPEQELDGFVEFLLKHDVRPDFFSFRLSYVQPRVAPPFERCSDYCEYMSGKPKNIVEYRHAPADYALNVTGMYRRVLDSHGLTSAGLTVTDFGAAGVADFVNDTCFKSAYLVKNMLDMSGTADAVSYGSFTDLSVFRKENDALFRGGEGLLTAGGVCKSVYSAYVLLNKLGDRVLAKGDGYVVTKGMDDSIQILIYNYCHYRTDAKSLLAHEADVKSIYGMFDNQKRRVFEFDISGVKGRYFEKTYRISRESGSVFESCAGGRISGCFDRNDLQLLNAAAAPSFVTSVKTHENRAHIQISAKPHEVVVIEMIPETYS